MDRPQRFGMWWTQDAAKTAAAGRPIGAQVPHVFFAEDDHRPATADDRARWPRLWLEFVHRRAASPLGALLAEEARALGDLAFHEQKAAEHRDRGGPLSARALHEHARGAADCRVRAGLYRAAVEKMIDDMLAAAPAGEAAA